MNKVKFGSKELVPTKIICIGWNYVEHIEELGSEYPSEPVVFLKPNSSISDNIYSENKKGFHYEGEISFIIENSEIAGVGFGFDMTKRNIQENLKKNGQPWERAKAFDNSAIFSPFIPFSGPFSELKMELILNEIKVQNANYDLMIYKPEFILEDIKKFITLEDGDIIMTGTPKGVGECRSGDKFTGKIYSSNELLIEKSWLVKPKV